VTGANASNASAAVVIGMAGTQRIIDIPRVSASVVSIGSSRDDSNLKAFQRDAAHRDFSRV
jgi:hypothetical protein